MFKINRYHYIDKKCRIKFEIFARKDEFADSLISMINELGIYQLRRTKIFFKKEVYVDIPPYELEQAQLDYIENEMRICVSKSLNKTCA